MWHSDGYETRSEPHTASNSVCASTSLLMASEHEKGHAHANDDDDVDDVDGTHSAPNLQSDEAHASVSAGGAGAGTDRNGRLCFVKWVFLTGDRELEECRHDEDEADGAVLELCARSGHVQGERRSGQCGACSSNIISPFSRGLCSARVHLYVCESLYRFHLGFNNSITLSPVRSPT
jgi:hypothetical protein